MDAITQPFQSALRNPPFDCTPIRSSPNALAVGARQQQLYVSYGANNAIGVFQRSFSPLSLTPQGMIPTNWFLAGMALDPVHNQRVVANMKGLGTLGSLMSSLGALGHIIILQTGSVSLFFSRPKSIDRIHIRRSRE